MPEQNDNAHSLPKPIVKKMRWPFPVIWVVPLAALIAAGFYAYDRMQDLGPLITLKFVDASGLKAGQTPLTHRGVQIGQVVDIQLSDDQLLALVHVRLRHWATAFARKGAAFWILRPEISAASISGLDTVVSGPYIEATPGSGESTTDFDGLQSAPVALGEGSKFILYTDHLAHLQPDSPVYFRGIQVGVVQEIQLTADSTHVHIRFFIWKRYAQLVRANSEFWFVGGADFKGGLFSGVEFKIESLRSLISGGVAFATPDDPLADAAKPGAEFLLHDEPKKAWLDWSPQIAVAPADPGQTQTPKENDLHQIQDASHSDSKGK